MQKRSPNEESPSQGDPSFNPKLFNSPSRDLNILLLGETGTGKSTTINALANYLLLSSFQDAATQQFKQLIPAKFSLPHPVTHQMCDITLGGEDANEAHAVAGSSVTQEPRTYSFVYGSRIVHFIDTPGMGDTRGAQKDKENFEKILAHLRQYRELHGICILIKATDTRTGASFRYCINELLTHLHKDAVKNMVFLFTFSRSTYYVPGDGFSTLQSFLSNELKEAAIPMVPNGPDANCFFIDNEAFRFLVAKKWGYPFNAQQEASFRDSWNISVEKTIQMFDRFRNKRPHLLESTLNLNHARKIILQLAEPLARLQSKNTGNIQIIKEKQASLQDTTKTVEELAKLLYLDVDGLESQQLEKPTTVCTVEKCTSVIKVNDVKKVHYWQKCHQPCGLTTVEAKIIGHPDLTRCLSMDKVTGNCMKCGCSWQVHMHIKFDYVKVKCRIIDTNRLTEIRTKEDAIRETKRFMGECQQAMEEFKEEMEVIHEASAFFACILINYSNTPYNRFLEPHLNLLIDEEERKINASGGKYSSEAKGKLQETLETHRANVEILQKAIARKERENVRLEDIDKHLDRLTSLKYTGPDLEQILGTFDKAQIRKMASTHGGPPNAARTVHM